MHPSFLLVPVVALVAWSLVMMIWMMARRIGAFRRTTVEMDAGARGQDLDGKLPPASSWPGHNYMHLMEQPTLFYAIVLALVLMGFDHPINQWLAWGYVGLRVLHSIVQATYNKVAHRFALFALSSFCLMALTVHAGLFLWHHG